MFRNLWKDIQWSFRSVPLVLKEWLTFYLSFSGRFQEFWKEKSISEKGLFITLTLQLLFSLSTWIEYTINLGGEETEGLRVSSNFYFIFLSAGVFFFGSFWRSHWLDIFLLSVQFLLGLGALAGIFFPESFFVNFLNTTDYVFSWKFYAFLFAWGFTTLFSLRLLFEKD
ncbi:hypothetical protein GS518_03760 [Leptospira interrogans]|uniref:Uncharacterized protein n=15 Tax=Leptospira interrogans TaxID=173 RepID=Q8F0Q4_LEPIN|nr:MULTISPECIES: hypothetical protein [Leptospira]EMM80631.1 hypothetical protein LEP1GSC037_5388 [Leptospira interrogans str. 2006001854]EMM96009.1 hypothetical protein LEP1GSC158_3211 [Leptospira interrogans serovar Zanoni str. LT2156]EMO05482.1 hypothetical protein LEP1GSC116_0012 [Leptospira interrogans serovar Icterohaemorrhagiae str. Verdun HP]KAA1269313.1 hypothetical protein C5473_16200 [Leptospira interrogans serovar Weerasinghe]KAA1290083.1 hypothetical protein C4X99_06330 [Leptospir